MSDDAQTQHWVEAEDGYQLALEGRRLICRDPDGVLLSAVPRKLMRGESARRLLSLGAMLVEHEKACEDTVERWMLHGQPIQARVLREVWADLAWRNLLEHLVVVAMGPNHEINPRHIGILLDVDAEARVHLLRPDQRELQLEPTQLMIPHPVILEHLASFLRLIHEEGIEQSIAQLRRLIWHKPAALDPTTQVIDTFRGQVEASPEALAARARRLGYRVQGGYAVCALQEWGRAVQARLWIGDRDPEGATHLGELQWVDGQGRALSLGMVGPVAFSEGHLMAQRLCQELP